MENVTFVEVENQDGSITEHAIIDAGNGGYTSMLKATYEEMIDKAANVNLP